MEPTSPKKSPKKKGVSGYALVKAVPSGDSIVVVGSAPAGQIPPEKFLTISGITVPRLGRGKNSADEVCLRSIIVLRFQ